MKKLSVLLAVILLFAACNKDNSNSPAPNLSPDGKQWIVELSLSPEGSCYFVDFTIGGGKAYSSVAYPQLFKIYSGFYFYLDSQLVTYSCEKSDDGTYALFVGEKEYTFTPYTEDTGIISWTEGTNTYNRLCKTLPNYVDVEYSPVPFSDYHWALMAYGEKYIANIATSEDGYANFNKLNGSYSCEVLTGNGEEADYDGKDVKGKIVFVSDEGSISFSKKREIAAEKEAVALIIYHYNPETGDDYRMVPYLKTYGSVPSGEGLPCGVIWATGGDINQITADQVSFPKG